MGFRQLQRLLKANDPILHTPTQMWNGAGFRPKRRTKNFPGITRGERIPSFVGIELAWTWPHTLSLNVYKKIVYFRIVEAFFDFAQRRIDIIKSIVDFSIRQILASSVHDQLTLVFIVVD
jgi:hypothetical protein